MIGGKASRAEKRKVVDFKRKAAKYLGNKYKKGSAEKRGLLYTETKKGVRLLKPLIRDQSRQKVEPLT